MQIGIKRMLRKVSIWSGVAGQRTAVAPGACGITGIYREQDCSWPVAQTHWVQHNKVQQTNTGSERGNGPANAEKEHTAGKIKLTVYSIHGHL